MSEFTSIKCVVVGDGAVGKTCLLVCFASNAFPEDYVPTVFDNYNANVKYGDEAVSLALWDTAGQEDYDRIRPLSYPDTNIFLICYSVVNPNSYQNVVSKWISEIRHYCSDSPVIIVGTKTDLRTDEATLSRLQEKGQSPVTKEQGEELRVKINAAAYVECSAATQTGVAEVFSTAVDVHMKPLMAQLKAQKKTTKKKKCVVM